MEGERRICHCLSSTSSTSLTRPLRRPPPHPILSLAKAVKGRRDDCPAARPSQRMEGRGGRHCSGRSRSQSSQLVHQTIELSGRLLLLLHRGQTRAASCLPRGGGGGRHRRDLCRPPPPIGLGGILYPPRQVGRPTKWVAVPSRNNRRSFLAFRPESLLQSASVQHPTASLLLAPTVKARQSTEC